MPYLLNVNTTHTPLIAEYNDKLFPLVLSTLRFPGPFPLTKCRIKCRNFVPICFTIEVRASQYSDNGFQGGFMLTILLRDANEGLEIAPGHVRYCQAIKAMLSTSDAASPLAMPEHDM